MISRYWRVKHGVIKHYDRIARIYDRLYGSEQNLKIKEILRFLNVKKTDVVLDLGCGTGILFSHINELANFIVGVDVSSMALKAAANLIKKIRSDSIFLVRADADFLPFRDKVFDKVFAITLLQNMPNPLLTLREMMRVTDDNSEIAATGLKKFFSKERFSSMLAKAGMFFQIINTSDDVKGHIALCARDGKTPSKSINKRKRIGICSMMVKTYANAW